MTQLMDEGARNYLYKYVKKNHWRVAAWVDFDDLIQEGYFAYYDTLRRYPSAETPQHIMSLFKLVLRSNIEDMVRKHSKQIDDARSDIVETYDSPLLIIPDFSTLHALLIKAPALIRDALALLNDEKTREELQKPFAVYNSGRRETLNERMCLLLGKDPKRTDIVKELRTYFA
jgi:DNA-directed RNA polymerase specialized sigma24 family protein